jgi:hypothetical protein
VHRQRTEPGRLPRLLDELQQQLRDDRQVAEVHDADVEPAQRQVRLPESEADAEQQRQQQRSSDEICGGSRLAATSSTASSLIAVSSTRLRRMSACRAFFMNWVSVRSSITRKATRNSARVIAAPVWKWSAEQQVLGDQEQRQDDQEEVVVAEGVVAMVADQRPQQHGDNGGEEQVAGQAEDQWWQFAGKPHAGAFEQPGRDEDDQRRAVVAANLHPVLGRGEQEAAEDGPAEAEEHLVRVPLAG